MNQEKKQPKPRRENYIFPNFLAKAMSKVDMGTQYEATMLSMSFMSIGLIGTAIYLIIYTNFQLWYKIFLIVNCFCGLIFMWSTIVTTFQQYKTYKEAVLFQKNNLILKGGKEDGTIQQQKENGNKRNKAIAHV